MPISPLPGPIPFPLPFPLPFPWGKPLSQLPLTKSCPHVGAMHARRTPLCYEHFSRSRLACGYVHGGGGGGGSRARRGAFWREIGREGEGMRGCTVWFGGWVSRCVVDAVHMTRGRSLEAWFEILGGGVFRCWSSERYVISAGWVYRVTVCTRISSLFSR